MEIEFVENSMFWNTGPSDSLKVGYEGARKRWGSSVDTWFVCYGDVIVTEVAVSKLLGAKSANGIVVDRNVRAKKEDAKSFDMIEACSAVRSRKDDT